MDCKNFSALYLNILNGILLVISVIMLGYGAYYGYTLGSLGDAVASGAVLVPTIFGAIMIVISIVGILGVTYYQKWLLAIYVVASIIIFLCTLIAGSIIASLAGDLESVGNDIIEERASSVADSTIDFGLAIYQKCCIESGFADEEPALCINSTEVGCITDLSFFNKTVDSLDERVCDFFENVDIAEDVPVVGNSNVTGEGLKSCGGNDPTVFIGQILDIIGENFLTIGIVFIVFAIIILIDVVVTCVLLWSSKDDLEKKRGEYEKELSNQAGADIGGVTNTV